MNRLTLLFLFICTIGFAQQRGEVFPHFPKSPTEKVEFNGVVVVRKSMYGLAFEDETISEQYKKAVKTFFNKRLNGYTKLTTYRLNIALRYGYIYVEGNKIQAWNK